MSAQLVFSLSCVALMAVAILLVLDAVWTDRRQSQAPDIPMPPVSPGTGVIGELSYGPGRGSAVFGGPQQAARLSERRLCAIHFLDMRALAGVDGSVPIEVFHVPSDRTISVGSIVLCPGYYWWELKPTDLTVPIEEPAGPFWNSKLAFEDACKQYEVVYGDG